MTIQKAKHMGSSSLIYLVDCCRVFKHQTLLAEKPRNGIAQDEAEYSQVSVKLWWRFRTAFYSSSRTFRTIRRHFRHILTESTPLGIYV